MATWYVSNDASNGYALGSDGAAGTSQSVPFLTVAHACVAAASGDTVIINPSATPYVEDSGSGYLTVTNPVSVGGDSTLYDSVGAPTIRASSSGATRVIDLHGTIAVSVGPLIIDAQSRSGQQGISLSGSPATVTVTQVAWKNHIAATIGTPGAACAFTLDRCTVDSTNTNTTVFNWTTTSNVSALTVKGGTYYAPSGAAAVFYLNTTNISGNVTFQVDSNAAQVDFTGNAAPSNIRINGTIGGAVSITGTKHSATAGGIFFSAATVTGAVSVTSNTFTNLTAQPALRVVKLSAASLTFSNNTYTGNQGAMSIAARALTSMTVQSNSCTVTTGASGACLLITCLGTSTPLIDSNTITLAQPTLASAGAIQVGTDGIGSGISGNSATRTSTISLGNASSNTFVAQKFTTVADNSSGDATYIAAVQVYLSLSGSPTGNVTAYLYGDSAGVPGTLLATSETTVVATSLTTSAQLFGFVFPPYANAAATAYWIALRVSGGTTDASNYVTVDYNATVTAGSIATGTAVPAWTADTAKCLRFQVYSGIYGVTPTISHNTIIQQGSPSALPGQMITVGPCAGCRVYGNFVNSTQYYPVVLKNCRNSTSYVYGNIVLLNSANTGSGACVLTKSSTDVRVLNNTLWVGGTFAIPAVFQASDGSLNWVNSIGSTAFRVQNNILIRVNTGGGAVFNIVNSTTTASYLAYNLVYTVTPSNVSGGGGWSAWLALGYGTGSVGPSTDPLLVNITTPTVATDFAFASTSSPAIGIGTDLTSSASTDYLGALFLPQATLGAYSIFTGELLARSTTATWVYGVIRNSSGQAYNTVTRAFERYAAGSYGSYALGLAQYGASGVWGGNMPALAAGRYWIDYRARAGASVAESDAPLTDPLCKSLLTWTGSGEIRPVAIGNYQAAA